MAVSPARLTDGIACRAKSSRQCARDQPLTASIPAIEGLRPGACRWSIAQGGRQHPVNDCWWFSLHIPKPEVQRRHQWRTVIIHSGSGRTGENIRAPAGRVQPSDPHVWSLGCAARDVVSGLKEFLFPPAGNGEGG